MSKPELYTDRGFGIYGELKDTKKSRVWVQESSAAGRPCCWIFAHNDHTDWKNPSPHLSVENAKELIGLLQKFVDHAQSEENWRNDPEYQENWG